MLILALVQMNRLRAFLQAWDTLQSSFLAAEEGVRAPCSVDVRVWQYKLRLTEPIPFKLQVFAIPWNKCCFGHVAKDARRKLGFRCHSQTKNIFIRKTISSEALTLGYVSYRQQGFQIVSCVTHLRITLTSEDSRRLILLPTNSGSLCSVLVTSLLRGLELCCMVVVKKSPDGKESAL